jgi:hypothetical protein
MKIIIKTEGELYACYIPKHDLYFSSKIKEGKEKIQRKAKAMVQCKENFLKEFPQYRK